MSLGPGDSDVDALVERINLNSPGHKVNPKKAAKKARQKLRKQAERQKKLDAEREQLMRETVVDYMDEAAEEFRYLTIGHRANCRDNKENKERQKESLSGGTKGSKRLTNPSSKDSVKVLKEPVKVTIEPMQGSGSKRRSFVIKDFPKAIQDSVQLVEVSPGVLQVRRKPVSRCNQGSSFPGGLSTGRLNGNSCFGTVELAGSDSDESDEMSESYPCCRSSSPPRIVDSNKSSVKTSNVVPDKQQQQVEKKVGNEMTNKGEGSKKKRKGSKRVRTATVQQQQQQSKSSDNNNIVGVGSKTDLNTQVGGGAHKNQRGISSSSSSYTVHAQNRVQQQQQQQQQQQVNIGHQHQLNWNRLHGESLAKSKPEMVHVSSSHIDSNRESDKGSKSVANSNSEKMVTIRRHPTVSDTTVTISVKNQNGEEDILYTLLNGQVVRTKPGMSKQVEQMDISNETTSTPTSKTKKKRNKRKNNKKKEQQDPEPQHYHHQHQQPQVIMEKHPVDMVTCTSVLHPHQHLLHHHHHHLRHDEPIVQNCGVNKTEIMQPMSQPMSTQTSSFFSELTDDVEIDLTKLKLPPGITITKVNQPISSFAGLNTGDKQSNDEIEIENSQNSTNYGHVGGSSSSIYCSDVFHSKPNVIVVDSHEYNVDNESDLEDYIGFKKRPHKLN